MCSLQLIVASHVSQQTSSAAQLSVNVSLACPLMPGPGSCPDNIKWLGLP